MEVTRAKLASVITEIARITPLTPDGNRTQSWPIGKLPVINISLFNGAGYYFVPSQSREDAMDHIRWMK